MAFEDLSHSSLLGSAAGGTLTFFIAKMYLQRLTRDVNRALKKIKLLEKQHEMLKEEIVKLKRG